MHAYALTKISLEADIQAAVNHKSATEQMSQLGSFARACGDTLRSTICAIEQQTAAVQRKLENNEVAQKRLLEALKMIFDRSRASL